MCESCDGGMNRRSFLISSSAIGAAAMMSGRVMAQGAAESGFGPREKRPVRVAVVFLYPPADVVYAGENEDTWRVHKWFTWPGNQFQPEQQQAKFADKIGEMAGRLGMDVAFHPQTLYQKAKIDEYIATTKATGADVVLVVNFWNSLAAHSYDIATQAAPTGIVYQPLGSNHQLPLESLRTSQGIYFIHSIENFEEIERALRAVRAARMMAQSRLLRISGQVKDVAEVEEADLKTLVVAVPAGEYNDLFDSIRPDAEIEAEARRVKAEAGQVVDVTDQYIVDSLRAHRTVSEMMRRYGADAITIECLFLKDRKPCVSFAINNGELVPCGCENHLDGTLTQMIGRWLWDRAGFMHNPEFDTTENRYFGSHCTCAWKLHGPAGPAQAYGIRPFFHQAPKTAAIDVQWTPEEPVILAKYYSGQKKLCCWTGRVVDSPTCPPAGGCATRVLVDIDRVDDVCDIYTGTHPILFCGDRKDARSLKAFARMCRLELVGNV
ncbi:MAG: hypothetical protein FJ276_08815 [Planctomycetes bacterium]|nr:hypothetical protein [Planctomycetota bacterium]